MRVDFSAAAKVDLIDIAVYIAQDNPERVMHGARDISGDDFDAAD